jgi:WS/DGAT/MGAT family acyltransferase
VKQLGIVDAAFVNLEHPDVPQHLGGLGIYDPSTAPGGFVRFKQLLASFERRLLEVPQFRTRLVHVPFGLDRPYWVTDDHFDVEFHLRHIALPKPGDWRQLCIQVARLHSRPLDMSRPLWEAYVIEGLDNIPGLPAGAFAIYTKIHHALVDGAGGQAMMTAMHDLEPQPADTTLPAQRVTAEREPGALGLLGRTLRAGVRDALPAARGRARLLRDVARTGLRMARGQLPKYPADAPKTRFDAPVGPHRVFDAASFDLERFKAIKNASGTTLNDVAVAVVSGAMRRYLQAKRELPEAPLAAAMPVNFRTRRGENGDNNQIGTMLSLIHTDVADPVGRLQAIHASLDEAKQLIDTPLADTLKLAGALRPAIAKRAVKLYVDNGLTRRLPMGSCGVITNVVGPPMTLYCAGAKLVDYHCLGVLTPGGGLFHAVFTLGGRLSLSFVADRAAMPDPQFYRACIEESFAEIERAVVGARRSGGSLGRSRRSVGRT